MESKLFTPIQIGPLTLRNRSVRAAAFESMCPGNRPSQSLKDYHTAVARGGIGMTTIAYASVNRSGLSFEKQLWLRPEIVGELKELTDSIHQEGAAASIQIGHCGNMSHKSIAGELPVSASNGFNIYSPTFVRKLSKQEIKEYVTDFGNAIDLAREAGFDCVEVHAGHGYLISQFLSPYTNRRKDEYGGSLENRMRFMQEMITEVMKRAQNDMAIVVKMNMRDGFKGGMDIDESLLVAKELERLGVHALVLSGGFVSCAPMYVMRGAMPLKTMTHYMNILWLKWGVKIAGRFMIKAEPYKEGYFLDDAKLFRKVVNLPLIYVGGIISGDKIEEILKWGFDAVAIARALVHDTDFIHKIAQDPHHKSGCKHSNYCIARMYSEDMKCHHCVDNIPEKLRKEIAAAEERY